MSLPDSLVSFTDPVTTTTGGNREDPALITDGLDLENLAHYRVIVSAASGQTLSGAGSLLAWMWSHTLAAWCRNPALDQLVTVSGKRAQVSAEFDVGVCIGRVLFAASGVTASSGAITVITEGSKVQS
jgi:hypothetical protein